DVDPQLERIRRRDAEQLAAGQAALDLSALLGGVAGTVRREPRVVAETLGCEAVDQLGGLARLREGEGAQAALDELRLQFRGLGEWGAPQAELLVEERRVPEDDRSLRPRRGIVADHGQRQAEQLEPELRRVGDGRRREPQAR